MQKKAIAAAHTHQGNSLILFSAQLQGAGQHEQPAHHYDGNAGARRLVRLAPLWWSRVELKRTLGIVIFYRVLQGFYRYSHSVFVPSEGEHDLQIVVIDEDGHEEGVEKAALEVLLSDISVLEY